MTASGQRQFPHMAQAVLERGFGYFQIVVRLQIQPILRTLPKGYSPDFLLRTANAIFLVETKAQQQTIHPNVQRKLKAAVAWCERINALVPKHRQGLPWHYVLLAENAVHEWQGKGAHLAELLDYARLRPLASASLQTSLL